MTWKEEIGQRPPDLAPHRDHNMTTWCIGVARPTGG